MAPNGRERTGGGPAGAPGPGRARRARTVLDLAVAVTLVVSMVTVQSAVVHLTVGIGFCALVPVHLLTRRALAGAAFAGRTRALRSVGGWLLLTVAVAMLVSGIVQWAGSTAAIAWHSGTGIALMAAAAVHVWSRRGRIFATRRARAPARARRPERASRRCCR